MPTIPERQNPGYEESDDGIGLATGTAMTITEHSFLTEDDQRKYRKEFRRRQQRRIRPGFAIPANRKDTE